MTTTAPAMTIEDLLAALKSVIDAAEGRSLTDEEVARYEELEAELAVARRDNEVRSRHLAYETPVRSDARLFAGGSTAVERSDEDRAFESYLRTGQVNADLMEFRAQSEGVDTAGGFTVPAGFLAKIQERRVSYGGIASLAETITTESGNPLPFPTNDDSANSGEIVAEGAAPAGGADLVFGVRTLNAFKYTSQGAGGLPIKVSVELLQDSAFDLETFLARRLGERIARKQARDYAIGSGSGEPQGLLTGLTSSATNAAAVPTYAELLAATYAVDEQYLSGAKWVMHSALLAQIQGIVDLNGRPLLNMSTDGIGDRPQRQLLGYEVVVDNSMPSSWTTGATPVGQKAIVFGNIHDSYLVRSVKGVTLVVLRELYMPSAFQVGFIAYARADAIVQDPFAATAITGHV